jgi:nucleotidyltransferase-like protein/aminoglycoside adenylyltransferase-like protein
MLPQKTYPLIDWYLNTVDHALPGRVAGFYVVGSAALGDFRPGRSDVDFVAVLTQPLDNAELRQLSTLQRRLYERSLVEAIWHLRWPLVCNGIYVEREDLKRPAREVTPTASHVAGRFTAGGGFDANPVTWLLLRDHGIPVRGPEPQALEIYHDDSELRAWTLGNLNSYWRRWAGDVRRPSLTSVKALLLRYVAWGVFGTARMHYTIATGQIASKTQAVDYALDVFPRWRSLLEDVRAYWLRTRTPIHTMSAIRRRRELAEFVAFVIDSAIAAQ